MKRVSGTTDIDTIAIYWCCGMNDHKKLNSTWSNTIPEKDYPKANLGNVTQNFEDIISLLRKICVPLGIFLEYFVIELLVPLAYEYHKKIPTSRMRKL